MVNKTRLVEEFCRLVSIDSVSFKEREMADILKDYLEDLGFTVNEDTAGQHYNGNCGNIYGFLKGDIEGDPILFSSHMDTVAPGFNKKAVIHEDRTITSDGTTVLGADDISGIVAILEAVRTIKEKKISHRDIEVLFTIAEEAYLNGSQVFDYKIIKAKEAYVLDLDGKVGTAALQAPTLISFMIKIKGKASHAGFAPEQGIHAIAIAAQAITQMKQGRIDEDTTFNIGLIEGGNAHNIVPEECILRGEIRSLSHNKAVERKNQLDVLLKEVTSCHKAGYEFSASYGCLAYKVEREHPVANRFEKVCKELDIQSQFIATFGGSDNNNFLKCGITGIVLACGMNKAHSTSEYTNIEELVNCSRIVLKLMTSE